MNLFLKEKIIEIIKNNNIYPFLKKYFYQTKSKAYMQNILTASEANEYISSLLLSDRPIVVSRLGSSELSVLKSFINKKEYKDKHKNILKKNAGFFPVDKKNIDEFCKLYIDILPDIDLLGISYIPFEDHMANNYSKDTKLTSLRNLEPYFFENPWSQHLEGKKVLVIHPFAKSIQSQYEIREKLFPNTKTLPAFELITLTSAQTLGGGDGKYKSWFDALKNMENQIELIDFDIAIIGAGVYGIPLAVFIKSLGKKAIHLGGSTQMLFGVYGQRWAIHPDFQGIINEYWIRPQADEKPKNASSVENACYW